MNLYKEFLLAAILHDVGKFYQKSADVGFDNSGQHPAVSKKFIMQYKTLFERYVNIDVLCELTARHHANPMNFSKDFIADNAEESIRPYAQMICTADNFSSSERDEETEENVNYKTRNLSSVFSRLSISDDDEESLMSYKMNILMPEHIFPTVAIQNIESANREHILNFSAEMDLLKQNPPEKFEDFAVVLDTVLKKYFWCVPSSSKDKIADVSLYDHLKTTQAIAACLFHHHTQNDNFSKASIGNKNDNKFKLVAGDFSGIQNYIFAVSQTSTKGVAKRLRARSFYVDAMVGALSHFIVDSFNLPKTNILMLTGGKFYILLPNLLSSDEKLEQIAKETDAYLYEKFKGEISVNLAWLDINGSDFKDYSNCISKLSKKLSQRKTAQYSNVLVEDGKWCEEKFVVYNDLTDITICEACGKRLINKSKKTCEECDLQIALGEKLTTSKFILYGKGSGEFNLFKDYYITLSDTTEGKDLYLVEQLNKPYDKNQPYNKPLSVRYLANNIPKDEKGEILTFNDIAECAKGSKHLAVLKADVDNLGFLFSEGLRKEEVHYGSISRISTMSRMLDMFFSGYINKLLAEKYTTVYSVFSGGDDLFLIGPWDVMPLLALEIMESFDRFSAQNKCMTLSAAITVSQSKNHISNMADTAEEKLKHAKNDTNEFVYEGKPSRNAVFFMDELFSWEDLKAQLKVGEMLMNASHAVNVSILRRVSTYSQMYKKFLVEKDVMSLMFEPMFYYDQKRNYQKLAIDNEEIRKFKMYAEELYRNAANYKEGVKKDLYFAQAMVKYALNKTRGERNNGV